MSEPTPALRFRDLVWPLVVCVGVRMCLVFGFLGLDVLGDEAQYLRVGRDFDMYGTLAGMWAPLYPVVIAIFHRVFGDDAVDAMRLFHVAVAAWTCVWIAILAARVGGRDVGRAAAWILAIYLPHAGFSGLLLSEVVFLALLVPALDALLRLAIDGRDGSPWWRAPLAGALMGLCALTRENASILLVLCVVWVAVVLREHAWRPALLPAAAFALAAAVVIAPWTIRNYHYFERIVPIANSTGGSSVIGWNAYDVSFDYAGLSPTPGTAPGALRHRIRGEAPPAWTRSQTPNRADRARNNVRSGVAFARAHPLFFLRSRIVEAIDFLSPTSFLLRAQRQYEVASPLGTAPVRRSLGVLGVLMFPLLALLALRGWVHAVPTGPFASLTVISGLATCVSVAVNGMSRYRMPFIPLLIVFAALALAGKRGEPSPRRLWIGRGIALLLVAAWVPSIEPTLLALEAIW